MTKVVLLGSIANLLLNVFNEFYLLKQVGLPLFVEWQLIPNWPWLTAFLVGLGVGLIVEKKGWLYGAISAAIGLGLFYGVIGIFIGVLSLNDPYVPLILFLGLLMYWAALFAGGVGGLLGHLAKKFFK